MKNLLNTKISDVYNLQVNIAENSHCGNLFLW